MLWFLHLASRDGAIVRSCEDALLGLGETSPDGAGRFVRAVLRLRIGLDPASDPVACAARHHEIGCCCLIARSVAFPVGHEPRYHVVTGPERTACRVHGSFGLSFRNRTPYVGLMHGPDRQPAVVSCTPVSQLGGRFRIFRTARLAGKPAARRVVLTRGQPEQSPSRLHVADRDNRKKRRDGSRD
ncbi:hypothetical protein [Paracoccus aeridis]|uniref:hypothetical protein n=1 Tax=Paracoccus aeridis TaxID=1966466 RepID=UPI001F259575|nr:hypothetical protein [Paracoccus aeridis]